MNKKSSTSSEGDTAAAEEHGELPVESVDPAAVPTESADSISLPPADSELPRDEEASSDDLYLRRSEQRGSSPEPPAMLTDDRLIETTGRYREVPEGFWQRLVYEVSFHGINPGDSRAARARKEMDARISVPFEAGTKFVPVLTRKGGVGKTTVTTLLGMAMASVREDRVLAVDANPDRGTLAERVPRGSGATVRDVVKLSSGIGSFTDFAELVSRDKTRLHVLASDTDPLLSEAFDEDDYNVVADQAARFYSVVLTDCGTGVVHSVMRPTLERANGLVVVSGGSVDEARLASETLTWLDANGYGELVKNSIVALNTATQGTNVVKLDEIEDHFESRVRGVVKIPYDPFLAAGSLIEWNRLSPYTREAARELAALVVEGMRERISR
jgi:MinD-like ATPase involved in chromosome partitioning or flagellar assembly